MRKILVFFLFGIINVIKIISQTVNTGFQIINEDGEFNNGLSKYMNEHYNNANISQIHVVSIIGRQRSGKSTLLNYLFNTKFKTMGDKIEKTTQGIFISYVENSNILVLDNEGIDGYENSKDKFGDRPKLERKFSLFSIYISDVIMVNINEKDVNTIGGLNIPLLEKVFGVLLKKDKEQEKYKEKNNNRDKKLLLIIVRDFSNTISIDKMKSIIIKQYKNIWNKIKPKNFYYEFEDYFDLECESLLQKQGKKPNINEKFYEENLSLWEAKKELFIKEINELKKRFFNPEKENYIFKNESKKNMKINYYEFSKYAKYYWNKIKDNSDLNTPTFDQLSISYRYSRDIRDCYHEFKNN